MRSKQLRLTATAVVLLTIGCNRPVPTDPTVVSIWMRTLYGVIRVERLSPPVASRLLVYASAALYSGLGQAGSGLDPLAGRLNRFPELPQRLRGQTYDPALTAVVAERVVLDSMLREGLPTSRAAVGRLADSLTNARVAAGVGSATKASSEDLGRGIGLAIVRWSHGDGFDSTRGRKYVPPVGEGLWANDAPGSIYTTQSLSAATDFVSLDNPANSLRGTNASDRGMIVSHPKPAGKNTLPAVNMAGTTEPYWSEVKPFALGKWNECPVVDPPAYSRDTASPMYQEARRVFATERAVPDTSQGTQITPEERAIAFYWADNAGESGTPPGHWTAISSQMVSEFHLSANDAARIFVMTAVAQADAFIAAWGYKFTYNRIRPRAYIRRIMDSTWEPLIPTPPFPEYPSAHSTQSAAAAKVLDSRFGTVAFDDSSGLAIGNPVRRFASFDDAAHEAGISRIYAGIHFPSGNMGGRALGECVGDTVVARFRAK